MDHFTHSLLHACSSPGENRKLKRILGPHAFSTVHQPNLVRNLGYGEEGIVKGTFAAKVMSYEARSSADRRLRCLEMDGISAALQSIGATGAIKEVANKNLTVFQERANELLRLYRLNPPRRRLHPPASVSNIRLPSYFSTPAHLPSLEFHVEFFDYKIGGYNMKMAEDMLNESMLDCCRSLQTQCLISMAGNETKQNFKVRRMYRMENKHLFEKFMDYEARVAMEVPLLRPLTDTRPQNHVWLQKLARKNGLSIQANTHYLMHGTSVDNLESISKYGLLVDRASPDNTYGMGLYFTDSSCKAQQYRDGRGVGGSGEEKACIIICRVVLGITRLLESECPNARPQSINGFHSFHARRGYTRQTGRLHKQLHNEYIAFDDCAMYPEFALEYDLVDEL